MRSHGSASDRVRPLDRAPFFWQSQYVSIREDQSGSSGQLRAVWQALNDASRLRLLALLQEQELSVSELQAITYLSQSLISSHLGVLKKAGVIHHRRAGKSHFYQASPIHHSEIQTIIDAAMTTLGELPEAREDGKQLKATLRKRRQDAQAYFNKIAGKLGKAYCPGRTWSSVGPLLSHLVPEVDIADLGAGEGWLTLMLAQRARHVIAVDNSRKMVEFARKQLKERKIKNVEYRLGDLDQPPIDPASVDIVVFSQALHHAESPSEAVRNAVALLRPGGRLIILDLEQHSFEQARDIYHDRWLGFSETEILSWMEKAGLKKLVFQTLEADSSSPPLKPLLASGVK
jgi:ubiquinone/menaquinone biosynthesis C-methylase UbiE/DNA-binding transcriptional ArsR family regulator